MLIDLMFDKLLVQEIINNALKEDLGLEQIDITTQSLISNLDKACAIISTRSNCVVSGIEVVKQVFMTLDPNLKFECFCEDGDYKNIGSKLLQIKGSASAILKAERTALNLFQRMCGISTKTSAFCKASERSDLLILDTRKTTPGLRIIEKLAVSAGGGTNHRMGLYDKIMIKDNHLSIWTKNSDKKICDAVETSRKIYPNYEIQVEVDTISQLKDVIIAKPDWVLLDNMTLDELIDAVKICSGICKTEASGGVTIDTIKDIAATGVDAVSIGALTHSVTAIDLGLDFIL